MIHSTLVLPRDYWVRPELLRHSGRVGGFLFHAPFFVGGIIDFHRSLSFRTYWVLSNSVTAYVAHGQCEFCFFLKKERLNSYYLTVNLGPCDTQKQLYGVYLWRGSLKVTMRIALSFLMSFFFKKHKFEYFISYDAILSSNLFIFRGE